MGNIDFSYIIGYKDSPNRLKNLKKVLSWLQKFNCEVIVIEQDTDKKIDLSDFDNVKHFLGFNDKHFFNRSWGFNCGAVKSESNIVVFGDCDLVMDASEFKDAIYDLKNSDYQCLSPYRSVIDLKKDESVELDIKNWKNINRKARSGTNLTGGVVIYKKESFFSIGGWHEGFEGWGGEDDYMSIKTKMFLKSGFKPYKCFHLWHPVIPKDPNLYQENLKILRGINKKDKNTFLKEIEKEKTFIGNLDKYKK